MPRKSSGALQSSRSPDLTPMSLSGFSPGKALGYSLRRAGWTNQMLPSAWARSAAWRSASLEVAGWRWGMLNAGAAVGLGVCGLFAREGGPRAVLKDGGG